jgi:hypothetical protein
MSEQNNAAAERSAHVERGPTRRIPGESFLVEVSPGVFQIKAVAEAADEIERLRAGLLDARREGFLAALAMAERRCEDAARYVRLRARTGEDHTVASTYEQAGAMIRNLPVPADLREPTGLDYRGG